MNQLKIFQTSEFGQIRTTIQKSEVLFAATDMAKCLGYANPQKAIRDHCKPAGVNEIDTPTNGGIQKVRFITKGNVIRLIANSTLPQAEKIESWIFDEVIPSVLDAGGYLIAKHNDTPEEIMARALLVAQETLKRKEQRLVEAEQKIQKDAPKVLFADAVATSHRACLVAELAKILQQSGVNIGQNRLFSWMRKNGYLCQKGMYYNQPTQKAMELGLFELKQTSITKPDGAVIVTTTPKVTGKGQIYFVEKFLSDRQTA